MRYRSHRNGSSAAMSVCVRRERNRASDDRSGDNYKPAFHQHNVTDETILPFISCGVLPRFWPGNQAAVVAGNSSAPESGVALKLRQCSNGKLAIVIKASWLIMKPSNHGNAFCINP